MKNTLSENDFEQAAKYLDLDPNLIKAVTEVESNGSGFYSDDNPKVLFEGHIFYKQLNKKYGPEKVSVFQKEYPTLVYPKWTKKFYRIGKKEFSRLLEARKIDEDCANMAASWGMFQILGENYKLCGCNSISEFVDKMTTSKLEQLLLFCNFIKSSGIVRYLRDKNWSAFARSYNGREYKKNKYDEKLKLAFEKYSHAS